MYDTGTRDTGATSEDGIETVDQAASHPTATPLATRLTQFRLMAKRNMKLYGSASRLALGQSLGQHRWLAAAGVAGALSLGLLVTGLVALVAPYSGVQTAALTAETTPQIIAEGANPAKATVKIAAVDLRPTLTIQPAPASTTTASSTSSETARADTDTVAQADIAAPVADDAAQTIANADPVTAAVAPPVPQVPKEVNTRVALDPGATLMQVLTDHGADRVDAYHAIAALRPVFSPTKLRSGQEINLTFLTQPGGADDTDGTPSRLLTSISLAPDYDSKIEVQRGDDGSYTTEQIKRQLTDGFARAEGTINSSLFLDAAQAGVPAPIIVEMIRMFSYSVDFQREIHPGDKFEVFFNRKFDKSGQAVKEGDISYASLTILGKNHKLWRYKMADGGWDYFDEKGRSMKKFLMKTPVDGARISSSFGRRKHPILGYTKMHSGVDFAAPRGTPIYAAGNGIVDYAARMGSYGNFVRIRHANGYQTAYAHMNGFARGIHKGSRVNQGQVIGYVGTTGRSTGPHLHYEIIVHGKKVNPLGIKVPTGTQLAGKDLKKYQATRSDIMKEMASATDLTQLAQADTGAKAN
ncbi:MAG: peptidoglycan DD-metalloendopeptidase family protein [Parvibaculum sp.]